MTSCETPAGTFPACATTCSKRRCSASADNVARYLQIDLPVSTAVDLLLGTPPMESDRDAVVSGEGGELKLWQDAGRRVYVTWFNRELEPIRYEQRDEVRPFGWDDLCA